MSLAVMTTANVDPLDERGYHEPCAGGVAEIIIQIENCWGDGLVFVP